MTNKVTAISLVASPPFTCTTHGFLLAPVVAESNARGQNPPFSNCSPCERAKMEIPLSLSIAGLLAMVGYFSSSLKQVFILCLLLK